MKRRAIFRPVHASGRIPDAPDRRDFKYIPAAPLAALPPKVDLRRLCPTPFDQKNLGSCTANAIAAALMYDLRKQRRPVIRLSRLFIYYNERALEGTIHADAGAQTRDGLKVAAKLGVCSEAFWRYEVGKFRHEPPASAYFDAIKCRVAFYHRLNRDLPQMKACLASGYPFLTGVTLYESFDSKEVARTGVVNMPARNERSAGGHCVLTVGYDDAKGRFIVLNSWGDNWGQRGYFTLPYEYMLSPKLSGDFWMATALAPASLAQRAQLAKLDRAPRRRGRQAI